MGSGDVYTLTHGGVNAAGSRSPHTRCSVRTDRTTRFAARARCGCGNPVAWRNVLETVAKKDRAGVGDGYVEYTGDGKTLTAPVRG